MKLFNIKSFHTLLKINYVHTVNSNGFRIMSHLEQSNLKTVKLAYSSFTSKHTDFTKEPLILMHGMFGYKRNFETIAKSLSNKLLRQVYNIVISKNILYLLNIIGCFYNLAIFVKKFANTITDSLLCHTVCVSLTH